MSHDVFISHSSLDKLAADAVCHGLEAKGIRCWIAPRDQIAGQPYGEQITSAIESAQVMVLVFSDNVNNSHAVLNEINIAASADVTIVPFRIAAVDFNSELHFYLGRMHWLDAFPQPVDTYIDTLIATVRRNLRNPLLGDTPAAPVLPPPAPPTPPPAPPPPPPAPPPPPEPAPSPIPVPPPPAPPPPPYVAPPPVPPGPTPYPLPPARQSAAPLIIAASILGVLMLIAILLAMCSHPSPPPPPPAPANNAVNGTTDTNAIPPPDANATPPPTPPGGDASADTTPIRAADQQAVTYYETVLTKDGPPASLSGAPVVNTAQLVDAMRAREAGKLQFWIIDARGCTSEQTIPTAICLNPDSEAELEDKVPDKSTELVIFCHDGACGMSYELAQQAVAAGYTNIFWYRGGINAWTAAGMPTATHDSVAD